MVYRLLVFGESKMKVLFLDIDGVLNWEGTTHKVDGWRSSGPPHRESYSDST